MSAPDPPVDAWWAELTTAALVGTARRTAPPTPAILTPGRPSGPPPTPEETVLDGAALGGALRRAGRRPVTSTPAPAAPDDVRPPAPPRAAQLLTLLLEQSPVGSRLQPRLLGHLLDEAARHGVRVPHGSLVRLLTTASTPAAAESGLRERVRAVIDARGHWLAAANPAWSWAEVAADDRRPATDDDVDEAAWAQLPTERRATLLHDLRAGTPERREHARVLLASTWSSDPAPARTRLLGALTTGLGPDDEPALERALDDRAAAVRELAWSLLDRLTDSARARRLGALLAPLLSTTRTGGVQVELPTGPDAAAGRDGLGTARTGGSERGLWLRRLAAGAPFEVWTSTTGLDPAAVVRTLTDTDALAGLRAAVTARRDVDWARALVDRGGEDAFLVLLPRHEHEARVAARLASATTAGTALQVLALAGRLPGPWPPEIGAAVLARLRAAERSPHETAAAVDVLAGGLHPSLAGEVQALAVAAGVDGRTDTPLHQLAQYLALVQTVTEAFA